MKRNIKKVICILCSMTVLLTGLSGCKVEKEKARPIENGTLKVGMNLQIDKMCYVSSERLSPFTLKNVLSSFVQSHLV